MELRWSNHLLNSVIVVIPRKIFDLSNARDVRLCSAAHNDAGVIPGTTITGGTVNVGR
jgi:hypothetical protein